MDYRPLYSLRIDHDYFDQGECRALQCRIAPSGAALWQRRGLLLKQFAPNEWAVLYDADGAGVDTASDVLEWEMVVDDPDFVLFTRWEGFRPYAAYVLDLPEAGEGPMEAVGMMRQAAPKRGFGSGFCRIRLRLTGNLFQAAQEGRPRQGILHFRSPEYRWEYLLAPRGGETAAGTYVLEEQGGRLHFPPFEPVRAYGRDLLRTVSEESVPMHERYDFKLRVVMSADGNGRKQPILRHVDPPVPGRFLDTEPGLARQVCNL